MKVLWICNIILPKVAADISIETAFSGGWLTGLSNDLLKSSEVELFVCAPLTNKTDFIAGKVESINYYAFSFKNIEKNLEKVIGIVKPDIIHIFGTELPHFLPSVKTCERLGIIDNVIVNIQGLSYIGAKHFFAYLPNNAVKGYTIRDIIKCSNINGQKKTFEKRGQFEQEGLSKVNHIAGRTDMDKACVSQVNPEAIYHFCNETLRDAFYKHSWDIKCCERYSIFVSQFNIPYKGFHILLESMPEILKKFPDTHLYTTGNSPLELSLFGKLKQTYYSKYIGKLIKKYHLTDKVTFLGSLNEEQMCERFLKSHVFVSASSIENSPNSVGEAMLLGTPTISSDVGGVKNMLTHEIDGFIYQADAPYMLSYYVCKIFEDEEIALNFSKNAKLHAASTHNREQNLQNMISIYKEVAK